MNQHKPLTYTVTMDARLAREVGVTAAMLYNLLAWQAQTPTVGDYDENGWFYCTAAYFEEKTSLHPNTFTKAIKSLVDAGLIECKRMFVKYGYLKANRSVNHFRVVQTIDDFLLTRNVSDTHTPCDLNNIKENIKEKSQLTPMASELTSPVFPVGAHQGKISVRPNKKEANPDRRPYAVGQAVLKAWGFKTAKIGVPMAKLIKGWLDAGFTDKDIIEAGKMMKQSGDEYWQKATPVQMLSSNGLLWYQTRKLEQNKPKTFEDYQREIAEAQAAEERAKDTSFWEAVKKFEAKQRGEL